jgi:hypothetical protein
MGKKLILLLYIVICFVGIVSAVPPVTTTIQFPQGYTIQVHPITQYFKAGEDLNLNAHVQNTSNGYPINASITCWLHLYNSSGSHLVILSTNATSELFDYSFKILGGNITERTKSYLIYCYGNGLGGYYSNPIQVNSVGKDLAIGDSILYIGFLTLMILLFVVNFVAIGYLPARNERDEEGRIMSINYLKYFRNVLALIGYFLFIAIFYMSSNLAFAFLQTELFAETLFMIFRVSFLLAPVVIVVWAIWIFASMFHDKEFQKVLNRGMFPGGRI